MRYLFDYMEDCIHLKACRRLQKIGRSKGHTFGRNCTTDCSAYLSASDGAFLTPSEACEVARIQYDGNSDTHDIYCSWDFPSQTIGEILEELENKKEA